MRHPAALRLPISSLLLIAVAVMAAGISACGAGPRAPEWPPKSGDPHAVPYRVEIPPVSCEQRSGTWSEAGPPAWSPQRPDLGALNGLFACPPGTHWKVDPAKDRWVVLPYNGGLSVERVRYSDDRSAIEVVYASGETGADCGATVSRDAAAVILLPRSAEADALPVKVQARAGTDCHRDAAATR
jgi:hypothetical protein